jgi:large subunit ribosomal protein L11
MKMPSGYAKTVKASAKEVVGTCVSMGVTVDQRDPKEILKEIEAGKYDKVLSG